MNKFPKCLPPLLICMQFRPTAPSRFNDGIGFSFVRGARGRIDPRACIDVVRIALTAEVRFVRMAEDDDVVEAAVQVLPFGTEPVVGGGDGLGAGFREEARQPYVIYFLPCRPGPLKVPEEHGRREGAIVLFQRIEIRQGIGLHLSSPLEREYLVGKALVDGDLPEQDFHFLGVEIRPCQVSTGCWRNFLYNRDKVLPEGPLFQDPRRMHARIEIAWRIHKIASLK